MTDAKKCQRCGTEWCPAEWEPIGVGSAVAADIACSQRAQTELLRQISESLGELQSCISHGGYLDVRTTR